MLLWRCGTLDPRRAGFRRRVALPALHLISLQVSREWLLEQEPAR